MNKYLGTLALGLSMTFLSGCAGAEEISLAPGPHPPVSLSAWAASWDADRGQEEYRQLKRKLQSLSCFMAYYDKDDKLFVPEETRALAAFAKQEGQKRRFLSITNDRQDEKGKFTPKDKELLQRLLGGDAGREAAAAEMIAAARELGCTGLELDYEAFFKDKELLQHYLSFTYKLAAACLKENLELRIVLEPGMPMDAGLCKGPEYVVMFYNLYGTHSGPGPKADGAFIAKTLKKMEAIPGSKAAAFATGGCLWEDYGLLGLKKGKARNLDEAEAARLAADHGITPERDATSYALHFSYKEGGHDYEVWYADSETLSAWIGAAARGGIEHISLWRLGGNVDVKDIKLK